MPFWDCKHGSKTSALKELLELSVRWVFCCFLGGGIACLFVCLFLTHPSASLLPFEVLIGKPADTLAVVRGNCSTVYCLIMIAFQKGMGSKV